MHSPLKTHHLLTLLLLIALASVTGLLCIPALPRFDEYFGISETKAQQVLSVFLIGYCLGQLPYGPLANRFGRKKTIYIGIALTVLGSLLSYFSFTFTMLCISRFVQALGAAVGLKMSFTIVGDVLTGKEASKVVSLLSIAFGIMPGLAVATGGIIVESFGWRGCFLFLSIYSLAIGLLSLFLPETAKKKDKNALKWKAILKGYITQISNKNLMLYAFIVSLSTMMIYLFATITPYICIHRLKISAIEFGFWNIVPATGLVFGALISKYCSMRYSIQKNILLGMFIISCGVIAMSISFFLGYLNTKTLFVGQFIIQSGYNLVWANANVAAISDAADKSNATTIVQFINLGGSVLATFLISFFLPTKTFILPSAFGIIVVLMFLTRMQIQSNKQSNS